MRLLQSVTLTQSIRAALCLLPVVPAYAAMIEMFWGAAENQSQLKHFSLVYHKNKAIGLQLPQGGVQKSTSNNTLRLLKGFFDATSKITHIRYDQYYQGIPVWGGQVIYHIPSHSHSKPWVTGLLVTHLETDMKSVAHKLSADAALAIAVNKYLKSPTAKPKITEIIYISKKKPNAAVPAYHIMYGGTDVDGQGMALHECIINANSGDIIEYWNGLTTSQVGGAGPGGVQVNNLPYRVGNYQFGNVTLGVNALGVMNIDYDGDAICSISNSQFSVINLENKDYNFDQLPGPLPTTPYQYNCTPPYYINQNDNAFSPINSGISPINDVTYFTQQAFNMYQNVYGVAFPIGNTATSLPVRSFTHAANYDNAFACDIDCVNAVGIGGTTQVMLYGNGTGAPDGFYPLTTIDIAGHELSHLVTSNFSQLIYENQSGGLNESFSDMAAVAIQSYINSINNPFKIWNGPSPQAPDAWTIGLSISGKTPPTPIRYLNNPPLDGVSIDNLANYKPGMDPHYSSGIFNKAFYLLSVTPGWSVEQAFRIMLDANMSYWIPNTDFSYAACGVIQAAVNQGYNYQDVINVFQQVGVTCLVGDATIVRSAA